MPISVWCSLLAAVVSALGSLDRLCIGLCPFSSLHGMAGNLCMCLKSLNLRSCGQLRQLCGIEGFSALEQLEIEGRGLTSLQPIGQLVGGLRMLYVRFCHSVQEEVLELPHIQPTANVEIEYSNVKEVVLAGVIRRSQFSGH